MSHSERFLSEIGLITAQLDPEPLEELVDRLVALRERNGRLFFLGLGGSAANCSHAVNDFRKIARIQAFTPVDNVAELTARINDDGWAHSLRNCLIALNFSKEDALFILSVGGGDLVANISTNLFYAVDYAKRVVGAEVFGIVGRPSGYTAANATICIVIPTVRLDAITPYTESFQSVLLHLIVTHPKFRSDYSEKNSMAGLAYES